MRSFILILAVFSASQSLAAGAIVRDGGTVEVGGVTYRLDGIDAPELDQICIDEHADAWACGVEARDQLSNLIGSRQVRCEDLGLGTTYRKRHIGICTLEGETASLNQLLVRQGFALNFEPYARGRFREDEAAAKANRSIKGKFAVRARVTGNVGVYHLQACRSYPALTKPDRWFCSEEDAQAAGFRKAYNCRAIDQKRM